MSEVTKPILLDETGQSIVTKLDEIKDAITNQLPAGDPVRITVVTPPTKTAYVVGDVFDPTGISVCAVFSNNAVLDITEQCVFSDEEISANDTSTPISWTWYPTSQVFTTTQSITVTTVKIVTWASGTAAEINDMLDAHYAGDINIYDYWTVGDERTVHLDAMLATNVGETHAAQDVTLVLVNAGDMHYYNDNWVDQGECAFVFAMKTPLAEKGYLNATTTTNYNECARATWCRNEFYNAFPSDLRSAVKLARFYWKSDTDFKMDHFGLLAEIEVFGDITYQGNYYSADTERAILNQFEYYETQSHRSDFAGAWFRSPALKHPETTTGCWCCSSSSGAYPSYDTISDDNDIVVMGII